MGLLVSIILMAIMAIGGTAIVFCFACYFLRAVAALLLSLSISFGTIVGSSMAVAIVATVTRGNGMPPEATGWMIAAFFGFVATMGLLGGAILGRLYFRYSGYPHLRRR